MCTLWHLVINIGTRGRGTRRGRESLFCRPTPLWTNTLPCSQESPLLPPTTLHIGATPTHKLLLQIVLTHGVSACGTQVQAILERQKELGFTADPVDDNVSTAAFRMDSAISIGATSYPRAHLSGRVLVAGSRQPTAKCCLSKCVVVTIIHPNTPN